MRNDTPHNGIRDNDTQHNDAEHKSSLQSRIYKTKGQRGTSNDIHFEMIECFHNKRLICDIQHKIHPAG